MNDSNRDLLVLSSTAHLSEEELDRQVLLLNKLLYEIETWDTFCTVNEIININRHKIIRKPYLVQKALKEKEVKPFVFTCNKN
jgi:hypothetical protein